MPKALITHPMYTTLASTWTQARDVYEGLGGFLDPERPYLVPHPREWLDHSIVVTPTATSPGSAAPNPTPSSPSPKLLMRRKLARYENIAETIVSQMAGALFLHEPARTFGGGARNLQIERWWSDVDGDGTSMTTAMVQAWTTAAVFGHAWIAIDKPAGDEPATAADVRGPRLCIYTPLDVVDWLTDDYGRLTAVKVLESAPRTSFNDRRRPQDYRVRIVTETDWTVQDATGATLAGAPHGFGRLPVAVLFAKRRPFTPMIGKSMMGDPQLHLDVYNLTSEVRELLRNQTFGILNVPLGDKGNILGEQQLIGSQSGTANVMFSTQPAQYISPDGGNVTVYHEHLDRLARMIYRLASAPWESDSREAESADARGRKRDEQHQILAKMAHECQRTELWALEMVYRALYGADRWIGQWEADQPTVAYPTSFTPPDWRQLAADVADAVGLELGPTATKELKKRFVAARLREADEDTRAAIMAEIDAQTVLTADEKQAQMLQSAAARMAEEGV